MTDKIHENWKRQGIPTWESQIPTFTRGFSQIEQDAMQQEIDALRDENERMRIALERIGNWGGTTRFMNNASYTDVARAALRRFE